MIQIQKDYSKNRTLCILDYYRFDLTGCRIDIYRSF